MTLEAGARLGHYRIIALLGRGGMADVYRAEDERLGREVALKAVPPEFARDPERVERFEREVRAAARLTHPNIVTVYEFGQGAGQHFYTMALMPGGDLKARIRAHPGGLPPAEARAVAAAMARALDYAHRQGFVHRDVKPENILFGEDGAPQLTDFGIARAMSSGARMTATGMSIGSPHYMSPEQARGKAVDGRSDLYSLGVVLYEMLTGRVPFDAADTLAVVYAHVNDPVPELPPAQQEWQPVLDRLLAKSPDDRIGSGGELAEDLAPDALPQATATRVMPARRDFAPTVRPKAFALRRSDAVKPRSGKRLAVAGGALLALAVVGIGYVALQDTDGPERPSSSAGGGSADASLVPVRPAAVWVRSLDAAISPGDRFRDRLAVGGRGPEMAMMPAGANPIGRGRAPAGTNRESTVRTARVVDFAMSTHEVTFDEYDRFAAATDRARPDDEGWGRGRRPVIDVSWDDAVVYAEWLSAETGARYRLPSASEWENAARAGTMTQYFWGNDIGRGRANCDGCGSRWDGEMTAPVGSFAPNAWGLHDMHGNVYERVCAHSFHNGEPRDEKTWTRGGECMLGAALGGSWRSRPHQLTSADRPGITGSRVDYVGFRVVRTLD